MGAQLTFLVRNSNDPEVAAYVAAKLDPANLAWSIGNTPTVVPWDEGHGCLWEVIAGIKKEATTRLVGHCLTSPTASPQARLILKQRTGKILVTYAGGIAPTTPGDPSGQITEFLNGRRKDMLKGVQGAQKNFLNGLLETTIKRQQKEQQEMAQIWRDLMKIDNDILIHKMSDHDPVIAQLAIQVAGKKRLPVEKECIALLKHANPTTRQTARQTLVRLARGVDCGPDPSANAQLISASIRSWSSWAAMQTDEPPEENRAKIPER